MIGHTLYEAPSREENISGPRDFAYMAEVDILGWKFRRMTDGALIIETPAAGVDASGKNMFFSVQQEFHPLLAALLSLDAPTGTEFHPPDGWSNVGRLA